jgi:hypothetical protein
LSSVDGFKIGELDASTLEFITNKPMKDEDFFDTTFANTIIALKDKNKNKCFKANLESLIHLGANKLNVRPIDTLNPSPRLYEKIQILGGTAPVCISNLLKNYEEAEKTAHLMEQKEISDMLMDYVLRAEGETPEKKISYAFENLTHLLCKRD